MRVLDFILGNEDWRARLEMPPYCLVIKEDEDYYLLNYSARESDFSQPIVRECRGLILKKRDLSVASRAFDKFFNVQEEQAADIDWQTAEVQEKLDGSLIKLWHDNGSWRVSTSGNIDAYKAPLGQSTDFASFGELFNLMLTLRFTSKERERVLDSLDKGNTYIFELCTMHNRVVVEHLEDKLCLIGVRNNKTFQEYRPIDTEAGKLFALPKVYPLKNLDQCLSATSKMGYNEEGFVVCDGAFNRVKIKSPAFVAAFHLKNNSVQSVGRILKMLNYGEQGEFLAYFPEFTKEVRRVEAAYVLLVDKLFRQRLDAEEKSFSSRKEYADWVYSECFCPDFMFYAYNRQFDAVPAIWLRQQSIDRQKRLIEDFLEE